MTEEQHVVILEENAVIRAILQPLLVSELPGVPLTLQAPGEAQLQEGRTFLYLHEKGAAIPVFVAAHDAFEKPVRVGALVDRLKRLCAVKTFVPILKIGVYDLEMASGTLMHRDNQAVIRLTEKENQILKILHDAKGKVVEKDALLSSVWGYQAELETHTLETHIYRLRQKIEKNAANPALLVTQENGYALKA